MRQIDDENARNLNEDRIYEERYVEVDRRNLLADRWARVVYFVFGVIEGLIAIRFVLRLLGANSNSQFAALIYNLTFPLLAPFRGLFSEPSFGTAVIEWRSLVAIVVYMLLSYALVRLGYLLFS